MVRSWTPGTGPRCATVCSTAEHSWRHGRVTWIAEHLSNRSYYGTVLADSVSVLKRYLLVSSQLRSATRPKTAPGGQSLWEGTPPGMPPQHPASQPVPPPLLLPPAHWYRVPLCSWRGAAFRSQERNMAARKGGRVQAEHRTSLGLCSATNLQPPYGVSWVPPAWTAGPREAPC